MANRKCLGVRSKQLVRSGGLNSGDGKKQTRGWGRIRGEGLTTLKTKKTAET